HKQMRRASDEEKLGAWTTVFTGFLEAVLPTCTSVEEHLFFQHFILDRVCVSREGQTYWIRPNTPEKSGAFIRKCFERLAAEGSMDRWIAPDPAVPSGDAATTLADAIAAQADKHRLAMQQAATERDRLRQENARLKSRNAAKTRRVRRLARKNRQLRKSKASRLARATRRLFGQ
ncbi:MAG: hypothetical protein RLO48_11640, partial [Bauldia litoralis]